MKRNPKYYIEHKLKPPKAFFDWCYSQIHTFKWSNKSKTILASDRNDCFVVEKRLTKRTNLSFFDKFYSFAIILVTSKRIEIQSYGFWSNIENGNQSIEMELINFEQFANDKHIKVSRNNGCYWYGLEPLKFMGGPYTGTKFYENDWRKLIKTKSELRYLKFKSDIDIERFYKYRREIEFAQKINASVLAEEIMYPRYSYSACSITANVDMRTINEKWLRNNKRFFKNSKRSFMSYELENRIRARGGKVVPGIEEYIDYRDVNYIPKGIGLVRFQNWIIKNKIDFKYYRDYLSLLKDLKINVDSENLIIPKDLTKAHNNAVELLIQMKIEIEEKAYIERLKQAKNYEASFDGFSFIFPKELNDLVVEGKALHHCVGSSNYVEGHKTGRTTIIFIRRSDEIDKPFYTMEFNHNQIIQVRGKHNDNATDDVNRAVDKWLTWKLNKKKRRSAA